MAQTQILNRRIRSIKNAKQITKAMEVVAASRMRRVQTAVGYSRTYAEMAASIIRRVAPSEEAKHHPYFKKVSDPKRLYIIFTSDRGLAGAFNSNIISTATRSFVEDMASGKSPSVVVFGRKGARFFAKLEDIDLIGNYEDVADSPEANVFGSVLETIDSGLASGQFNTVNLIYTEFVSTLNQRIRNDQLLPISLSEQESTQLKIVFEFEPSMEEVLEEAIRLYFESQLIGARTESAASEYAMRMIAMGNANRNAGDIIDGLTLELNATRQAAITQEIAEITGGASAIAG
ncbi:ATP synthase F1 subunit gamma [Candidatus Saccharibacteria bacterium]|nr:ATP synthase F1 subunit gamma [Candidatus Saccharibacteria bacterium]